MKTILHLPLRSLCEEARSTNILLLTERKQNPKSKKRTHERNLKPYTRQCKQKIQIKERNIVKKCDKDNHHTAQCNLLEIASYEDA